MMYIMYKNRKYKSKFLTNHSKIEIHQENANLFCKHVTHTNFVIKFK